jgi:natural product precursor
MKPRRITKKLRFNKKTISNLNNNEMNVVNGGYDNTLPTNCGCPTIKSCNHPPSVCICIVPEP